MFGTVVAQSPIDAGFGAQVTDHDVFGSLRHDDLGVANTGAGWPAYVDLGAMERTERSPGINLCVSMVTVSGPTDVHPGDNVRIGWELFNSGDHAYPAGVVDAVYLSTDRHYDAADIAVTEFIHGDASQLPWEDAT